MYLEQIIKLNNYISSLSEPQRFFAFMGLFVGGILLILGIIWVNNKIDKKNMEKRIITINEERKTKDPNCTIIYQGKIF